MTINASNRSIPTRISCHSIRSQCFARLGSSGKLTIPCPGEINNPREGLSARGFYLSFRALRAQQLSAVASVRRTHLARYRAAEDSNCDRARVGIWRVYASAADARRCVLVRACRGPVLSRELGSPRRRGGKVGREFCLRGKSALALMGCRS